MNKVVNENVAQKYLNNVFATARKILKNNFEEISVEFTSYKENWEDKYIVHLKSSKEKNNFIEVDLSAIENDLYEELLQHCITFYKETNVNEDWNTFIFVSTKDGEWSCEYDFIDKSSFTEDIEKDLEKDIGYDSNSELFADNPNFDYSVQENLKELNNMYDPILSSSITDSEIEAKDIEENLKHSNDRFLNLECMDYEDKKNNFDILDSEEIKKNSILESDEKKSFAYNESDLPEENFNKVDYTDFISEEEKKPMLNNLYISKNVRLFDLLLGLYKGESVPSKIVFENQVFIFNNNDYIRDGDLLLNQSLILNLHSMKDFDKEIQIL